MLADLGDLDPVILMLADRADGDLVLRALRLGARGYVMKAGGLGDSRPTVGRVIAGERVMTPHWSKTRSSRWDAWPGALEGAVVAAISPPGNSRCSSS